MSEPSHASEAEKPKPRSWWKWALLILLVLLGITLVLINGPTGRWLIKTQLLKAATTKGLEGDFTLSGSLLSGYQFSDLQFRGDQGIENLSIGTLSADYTLSGLRQKTVDGVSIDTLQLTIDTAKFPKSASAEAQTEEEQSSKPLRDLLASLRPWVTNPEINLNQVDLKVLKKAAPVVALQFDSFSHAAGSDRFELKGFKAQNAQKINTAPQDVTLRWGENDASINQWEVLPEITLLDTSVDWSEEVRATTGLRVDGALLQARMQDDLAITLTEGTLKTDFLAESFDQKLPFQGSVEALEVDVQNWRAPLREWNIAGDLKLTEAVYAEYDLRDTALTFSQRDANYTLDLDGVVIGTPAKLAVKGAWTQPEQEKWWSDTRADYALSIPSLGELPEKWSLPKIESTGAEINLAGELELVDLSLRGITTAGSITTLQAKGVLLPPLAIEAQLRDQQVNARVQSTMGEASALELAGSYHLKDKNYEGRLDLTESTPEWINALIQLFEKPVQVTDRVALAWAGKGSLLEKNQPQEGELTISALTLELPKIPSLSIRTNAQYNFPQSIAISNLHLAEEEWQLTGDLNWDNATLRIPNVTVQHQADRVATLSGEAPYTLDAKSLEAFLEQTSPLALELIVKPLALQKIQQWTGAKIPAEITGEVEAELSLFGSPATPQVQGYTNIINLKGITPELDEAINLNLDFASAGESLAVQATAKEADTIRILAEAALPFTPLAWVQNPGTVLKELKDAPLKASGNVKTFPLERIATFVPQLEQIDGAVTASGEFTGSINQPVYQLDIEAEVPLLALDNPSFGEIRDITLKSQMTEAQVISNALTAQINGGKFNLEGTVDIKEPKNPLFDLTLNCDHALLYRDDLLSARANADLQLQGPLKRAVLTGDIGLTESLVYKDIELIPIGVPSSAVAKVQLPALSSGNSSDPLPIPAPFSQWLLDLTVKTEDPVLLRGNLASGSVEGSVKLTGNLERPVPNGTFYLTETKAQLPFSVLEVERGELAFTPQTGLMNPTLKIPGKSSVGGYDVNLLVYGGVSNPATSLTSSPPLPESEIMSLLATGTTTSALANRDAVALKAFQLLLLKLQNQKSLPFGNSLFKLLLTGLSKLDLQVGQNDDFTGRKFTSASIDLSDHWHFTTQIDDKQYARGLLVYLIRFK